MADSPSTESGATFALTARSELPSVLGFTIGTVLFCNSLFALSKSKWNEISVVSSPVARSRALDTTLNPPTAGTILERISLLSLIMPVAVATPCGPATVDEPGTTVA